MKIKHSTKLFITAFLLVSLGSAHAESASQPNAVQIVTSSNNYAEMDSMPQALIQLCKDECTANKKVLEKLAPDYSSVAFVQMKTADNLDFTARMEREQQLTAESTHWAIVRVWRSWMRWLGWGGEYAPVLYPMYIFKGSDLNVAPEIASNKDLKTFIEINASYSTEESK